MSSKNNQLEALEDSVCKTGDPTIENALQCGCHSAQSDFKGGFIGPCEVTDLNGDIFVTGNISDTIIQLNVDSGNIVHHEVPQRDSVPVGISRSNDKIWFSQMLSASISSFNPSTKEFSQFSIREEGAFRTGSTTVDYHNGEPWFTASTGGFAGKIVDKESNTVGFPGNLPGPRGMKVLDDIVYVCVQRQDTLYKVDKEANEAEPVVKFSNGSQPIGIEVIGNKGYVTLSIADGLAVVDLENEEIEEVIEFEGLARPSRITEGPDGNIWLTKLIANKISRVDIETLEVTDWEVPFPSSAPEGIHEFRGDMWFVMWAADRIGRFNIKEEKFETWVIPGAPTILANLEIIKEIRDQMVNNRSKIIPIVRSPSQLPLSSVNLKDRINPQDIIDVYDSIVIGMDTMAETGNEEEAVITLMESLPQRGSPTSGNRVILGFAGWVSLLNTVISLGFIQKIDQFIQLLIILIKQWLEHRLDP